MKWGMVGVVLAAALVVASARADEEWPQGTWSSDVWRENEPRPRAPARVPRQPAPPPLAPPVIVAQAGPPATRPLLIEYGAGTTLFAALGPRTTTRELGGAFQLGLHQPLADHFGVGFRLGWGLTSWKRTEHFAHAGYVVATKTTEFIGDAWSLLGEKQRVDEKVGIAAGLVIITFLCIVPYVISGVIYALSPLAATSSLETAATLDAWPGADPRHTPFLGVGGSAMLYVLADTGRAFGGVGPTANLGYRFGDISLGLVGTFLPYGGHGRDSRSANAHILTSTLTLSVVGK